MERVAVGSQVHQRLEAASQNQGNGRKSPTVFAQIWFVVYRLPMLAWLVFFFLYNLAPIIGTCYVHKFHFQQVTGLSSFDWMYAENNKSYWSDPPSIPIKSVKFMAQRLKVRQIVTIAPFAPHRASGGIVTTPNLLVFIFYLWGIEKRQLPTMEFLSSQYPLRRTSLGRVKL